MKVPSFRSSEGENKSNGFNVYNRCKGFIVVDSIFLYMTRELTMVRPAGGFSGELKTPLVVVDCRLLLVWPFSTVSNVEFSMLPRLCDVGGYHQ